VILRSQLEPRVDEERSVVVGRDDDDLLDVVSISIHAVATAGEGERVGDSIPPM
jgi:hypothetical protein